MRPLVVLALLGLLAFAGLHLPDLLTSSPPARPSGPPVTVFGAPSAPDTWAAEAFFRRRGFDVRVRDITTDPAARAEHVRLGSGTLPVILVGSERLEGFREWEAERVLDRMARKH
jgi:glutaredoxin